MKNKNYSRLCAADRKVIYNMNQAGKRQIDIALAIGCSQSTISKELARNKGQRGYRPKQAHCFAVTRQSSKPSRPKVIVNKIKEEVEARLRRKHSPEQISGAMKIEGLQVSTESIYQYIIEDTRQGGDLRSHLRINGKRRYKRRAKTGRGEKIPNRVDIEERPQSVEARHYYGDWEADLIEGSRGSGFILSLYERKSRLGKLYKLSSKGAYETACGIVSLLREHKVRSVTYDNGLEFSKHEFVNDLLNCKSFFCKPYSSWEKGGVENFNGLVRQYYPKGSSFSDVTQEDLIEVEAELNERPRDTLNYKCPNDFIDHLSS